METNENMFGQEENQNSSNEPQNTAENFPYSEIKLGPLSIEYLREVSKWARFLAILGLVVMGFYVIGMILMSSFYGFYALQSPDRMGAVAFIPMIIIAFIVIALYITPIWWLYKFADNLLNAINLRNSEQLTEAFNYLKKHYKFIGIMTIVMLAIYLLSFFGLFATGLIGTFFDRM